MAQIQSFSSGYDRVYAETDKGTKDLRGQWTIFGVQIYYMYLFSRKNRKPLCRTRGAEREGRSEGGDRHCNTTLINNLHFSLDGSIVLY